MYIYSNNEINWLAVQQHIPLQCYPRITKEILATKFTNLKDFLDSVPIGFYTIQDLKQRMFKSSAPAYSKNSISNKIKENNEKAKNDKDYPAQTDNRCDKLHSVTFCHAPLVPAKDILKLRKSKNIPITPISNYDLSHIKWTGKISDDVWAKLHDLSSKDLKLKFFFSKDPILQTSTRKIKISPDENSDSFEVEQKQSSETFDSISQVRSALRVLIEAQQAIFPLNKSSVIIDKFITDKGDFQRDLRDRLQITSTLAQARFMERFINTILEENAIRYENDEDIYNLDTLDTRYQSIIAAHEIKDVLTEAVLEEKIRDEKRKTDNDFVSGNKSPFKKNTNYQPYSPNFKSPNKTASPSPSKQQPQITKSVIYRSICREFNKGKCTRMNTYDQATNTCLLSQGTRLLHQCNYNKPDNRYCLDTTHNYTTHNPKLHNDVDIKFTPLKK